MLLRVNPSFIAADGSLVLVQDHPARLIAKACAEFDHAFAPSLARQHRLVDDDARLAPVLDVEHRLYVGGAVAGETLVGPAEGGRRQDEVVELKVRTVRTGRPLA